MNSIEKIFDNKEKRSSVISALHILKDVDLFSILLWRRVPSDRGFNAGDSEALSLSAAYVQGYKAALEDVSDPFNRFKDKEK